MEIKQIKETCLYVTDLHATKEFYHEKLKLPLIALVEGRHVFFRVGTSVLLCFIAQVTAEENVLPPHFAYGKQHIAFEVDAKEYELWKDKIRQHGISIDHEQLWGKNYKSFYFEDPDGHVLEIVPTGMWD